MSATRDEPPIIRPKISLSYIAGQLEPTVVHRAQCKSRPSMFSISPDPINNENNKVSSDSSSGGKSSTPNPGESTGKTSIDSKYHVTARHTSPGSDPLTTICERHTVDIPAPPLNQPSNVILLDIRFEILALTSVAIQTVESVAATKIFFETHYNRLTSVDPTPRSLRLRRLEGELYENMMLDNIEKEEKRQGFYKGETDYLRELRVMKATHARAGGKELAASRYEVVRVSGIILSAISNC